MSQRAVRNHAVDTFDSWYSGAGYTEYKYLAVLVMLVSRIRGKIEKSRISSCLLVRKQDGRRMERGVVLHFLENIPLTYAVPSMLFYH